METYAENPTIRGIVDAIKGIPALGAIVSLVDAATITAIKEFQAAQYTEFIEEIGRLGLDPDAPLPKGEKFDVIRAVLVTTEAVALAKNQKKAKAFARLLSGGFEEPPKLSLNEELDDYLGILSDLSARELGVLGRLSEIEAQYLANNEDLRQEKIDLYWPEFLDDLASVIGIPLAETAGFLARLQRTGMYEPVSRTVAGFNRNMGQLSGSYYRLAEMIRVRSSSERSSLM